MLAIPEGYSEVWLLAMGTLDLDFVALGFEVLLDLGPVLDLLALWTWDTFLGTFLVKMALQLDW